MAVQQGEAVRLLGGLEEFYANPAAAMSSAQRGDAHTIAISSIKRVPFVPAWAKVLCVGLNYRSHAEESSMEVPQYPTVFGRWTTTLICDGDAIPVPASEPGLDWEVELAVIIGTRMVNASIDEALGGILGYTAFNDVSARRRQFETAQWTLGKNPDLSGPIGPVIVTRDEFDDYPNLRLSASVNGETVQDSVTSEMIFSPAEIISYISKTATLMPGDVICTGTPEGVGFVRRPPRYLVPGDTLVTEIESIGRLTNPVVGDEYRHTQGH